MSSIYTICSFLYTEISPAYCVFKKNYSALINMLKSTDLYRYFVSEEIITPAENDEISAESNPLTKAQMFLQKVSSPLESGQTNSFYAVVDVMATYGNRSTKELARSINVTLHASVPDGGKIVYYKVHTNCMPHEFCMVLITVNV